MISRRFVASVRGDSLRNATQLKHIRKTSLTIQRTSSSKPVALPGYSLHCHHTFTTTAPLSNLLSVVPIQRVIFQTRPQKSHRGLLRHEKDANYSSQIVYATSPFDEKEVSIIQHVICKLKGLARTLLNALFVAYRSGEIALRFSPLIVLTPAAILSSSSSATSSSNEKTNNRLSDWTWNYSLYTVQCLGPAFIKICQWAATRRDIFPPNVCDRLSTLHDATFSHSWHYTHQVLTKTFGRGYDNINGIEKNEGIRLKIDPADVIGSGSVAQVYRGELIENNGTHRTVAVKVLHPRIHEKIERDLGLMQQVASLIHSMPSTMIRMMNLPRVTANFATVMRHQIDLRHEGDHLRTFRENFVPAEDGKVAKVSFPKPILVDENCLIEDYVDAMPIAHFLKDDSQKGMELRQQLAGPLLRAFLKMVFMDNFVHSDLHQGNIKVRRTRIQPSGAQYVDKYTIVFLDAGIVTSLNEKDQQNLKDLFKAVILNDGEKAGRLMVERAKFERCSEVEGGTDQFAKGISDIVCEFHDRRKQGLTLGVVKIGALLSRVLDLCRIHGVEIDPAMSNIVMSTLVLEGLGRSLDSSLNLFDIALPFVLGRGKV